MEKTHDYGVLKRGMIFREENMLKTCRGIIMPPIKTIMFTTVGMEKIEN